MLLMPHTHDIVIQNFTIIRFKLGSWPWAIQLDRSDYCTIKDLIVDDHDSGINLYRSIDRSKRATSRGRLQTCNYEECEDGNLTQNGKT